MTNAESAPGTENSNLNHSGKFFDRFHMRGAFSSQDSKEVIEMHWGIMPRMGNFVLPDCFTPEANVKVVSPRIFPQG